MKKHEAERAYSRAWAQWKLSKDKNIRLACEQAMDAAQPYIAKGPGPEWDAFKKTLPGFLQHWDDLEKECIAMQERLCGDETTLKGE